MEPSVSEASQRVQKDLEELRAAVQRQAADLRETAGDWIQKHPLPAVGAAFAVGFLLSGGLFSKWTARGLRFGSRFLLGRVMRELLGGAAAGFVTKSSHS